MLLLQTLAIYAALVELVCAGAAFVLWRFLPEEPGVGRFALGYGVTALGSMGIAFRGQVPDLVSVLLANLAIIAGTAVIALGVRASLRLAIDGWWRFLVPGVLGVLLVGFLVAGANVGPRVFWYSILSALLFVLITWAMARHGDPEPPGLRVVSVAIALGFVVIHLVRAIGALTTQVTFDVNGSPSLLVSLPFLYGSLFCVWFVISLVLTISMRTQRELAAARDRAERTNLLLAVAAETDPVTQLVNRSKLEEVLEEELERVRRYAIPLSVILVDLDHFKDINDSLGHQHGDDILAAVAEILGSGQRANDTVGRWGGDEFLLVLPETDNAHAVAAAERIRAETAQASLQHGTRVSASFGVASYRRGDDVGAILARADAAMYEAKRAGRNLVMESDPVS